MSVDFDTVMPAANMAGDDPEDARLLHDALSKARAFIGGHEWCARIRAERFGLGIGGIVSVFLFQIDPARENVDEFLWVVVGDLPSVYLVTDEARDPAEALTQYIGLMRDWVLVVNEGGDLSGVFPVEAAPTQANASALESRLDYLEKDVLPEWRERCLVPSPLV